MTLEHKVADIYKVCSLAEILNYSFENRIPHDLANRIKAYHAKLKDRPTQPTKLTKDQREQAHTLKAIKLGIDPQIARDTREWKRTSIVLVINRTRCQCGALFTAPGSHYLMVKEIHPTLGSHMFVPEHIYQETLPRELFIHEARCEACPECFNLTAPRESPQLQLV